MAGGMALVLDAPAVAASAQPGQFAQVLPEGVLLRRPFSFNLIDRERGQVGILFQVVGAGTSALARLQPGDVLDLMGPLGRGFVLRVESRRIAIVAGGLGVAAFPPLVALAQDRGVEVEWCLGAATADRLSPAPPGVRIHWATEDGSLGHAGRVTDLLARRLPDVDQVFACGPTAMLRTVAGQVAGWAGMRAQAALETPMGCGVGTCLGCAVPSSEQGFRLACVDGPVLPFDAIDWARLEAPALA
jgi:dihydroorotate dehydrogenase electron transfer subunit